VMIRFIDIHNGKMTYKAGGGITSQSKWQEEYNELIEKTYVPICRND
jgi:para-aminobenzoate synthase component I